jgi:hypothetical protein
MPDIYDDSADVVSVEPDGSYWVSCWACGGAGYHEDSCECEAFEDVCCCAEPEPPECSECHGKGALGPIKPKD